MYKNALVLLTTSVALLAFQNSRADILADWNFQTTATNVLFPMLGTHTTFTNAPSDIGSGLAAAGHASASTVFSSPAGNGSTNSVSANNWTVGDFYQFSVSSIGFTNLIVSFGQVGSATGPRDFSLQYSANGGAYQAFSSYALPSSVTSWSVNTSNSLSSFSFDLSAITALADQSLVSFRLVDLSAIAINGNAVGTGGTDRVDDFTISGTSLTPAPEPSTMALAFFGGAACLFALRRRS